ncbi:hypothetical protein FHS96_005326, partial [Sphingomonas zeicaulis]
APLLPAPAGHVARDPNLFWGGGLLVLYGGFGGV